MAAKDNYYPAFDQFKKLSKKGNLIPVYREIFADMETPVSAFKKLNAVDIAFYLKALRAEKNGRVTAFSDSTRPLSFKSKGRQVEVVATGRQR